MDQKVKFYSFAFLGLLAINGNKFDLYARSASPEGIKERRDRIEERIEERVDKRMENLKNSVAKLDGVKITAKDSNSITVDNNGVSVKVNISSETKLRRRFWGNSDLAEFSIGNTVNIFGKWVDETKTGINAKVVRNISIQKRYGVFFGEVKSMAGDTFVITSIHRDEQTVTSGTAKLINRKEETVIKSDILVGHKVRVKGLWDNSNNTITEVKEIKNFSLPLKTDSSEKNSPSPEVQNLL